MELAWHVVRPVLWGEFFRISANALGNQGGFGRFFPESVRHLVRAFAEDDSLPEAQTLRG